MRRIFGGRNKKVEGVTVLDNRSNRRKKESPSDAPAAKADAAKADIAKGSPLVLGGEGSASARDESEDQGDDVPLSVEGRLQGVFHTLDESGSGAVERDKLINACRAEFPRAAIQGTPAVEASEDVLHRYVDTVVSRVRQHSRFVPGNVITLQEFKDCFPKEGVAPEDEPSPGASPDKAAPSFKVVAEEGVTSLGFQTSPPPTAVVKSCEARSWAERHCIMPGDQLKLLNGLPVGTYSKDDFVRCMFKRPLELDFLRDAEKAERWQNMRSELMDMSMKQVRAEAREVGVTEDELDDADDDDFPKATIIELIVSKSAVPGLNREAPSWEAPSQMSPMTTLTRVPAPNKLVRQETLTRVRPDASPGTSPGTPTWGKLMVDDGLSSSEASSTSPASSRGRMRKTVSFDEDSMDGPPPLIHSQHAAAQLAEAYRTPHSHHSIRPKTEFDMRDLDVRRNDLEPDSGKENHPEEILDHDDPFYGLNRWFRTTCGSFESALVTTLEDRKIIAEQIGHLRGLIDNTPGARNSKAFGCELSEAWMEISESTFLDMMEKLRGVDSVQVRSILVYLEWALKIDPQITTESLLKMWQGKPDRARQKRMLALRRQREARIRARENQLSPMSPDSPLALLDLEDSDLYVDIEAALSSTSDPIEREFLQMLIRIRSMPYGEKVRGPRLTSGWLGNIVGSADEDLDSIDLLLLQEDPVDPDLVQEAQRRLIEEVCDRLTLFYGSIAEGFKTMVNSTDGRIGLDSFCAHLGFFRTPTPPLDDTEFEQERTVEYGPLAIECFSILDYDNDGEITALNWMHAFSAILGADDYRLQEIKAERRRDMFKRRAGDHMKNILHVAVVGRNPMINDFASASGEITQAQLTALVRGGLHMDSGEVPDEEINFLVELLDDSSRDGILNVSDIMEYAMSDEKPEDLDKRKRDEAKAKAVAQKAPPSDSSDAEESEDSDEIKDKDEPTKDSDDDREQKASQEKAPEPSTGAISEDSNGGSKQKVSEASQAAQDGKASAQAVDEEEEEKKEAPQEKKEEKRPQEAPQEKNEAPKEMMSADAFGRVVSTKTVTKKKPKAKAKAARIAPMDADRMQGKLKNAVVGIDPKNIFAMYDKDNSGSLDAAEFKELVRNVLNVSTKDLPDEDIDNFIKVLDRDGAGTISIEEASGFLDQGAAVFEKPAAKSKEPAAQGEQEAGTPSAGEKAGKPPVPREEVLNILDEKSSARLQSAMKGAVVNLDPQKFFKRYDKGGDGLLDADEFKTMIRKALRIPKTQLSDEDVEELVRILDRDGNGISIEEAGDFVIRGHAALKEPANVDESAAAWGVKEKPAKKPAKKKKKKAEPTDPLAKAGLDEASARQIQARLKAATFGTDPKALYKRIDKDNGGNMSIEEFKKFFRKQLKITDVEFPDEQVEKLAKALDRDKNGSLNVLEFAVFVTYGVEVLKAEGKEQVEALKLKWQQEEKEKAKEKTKKDAAKTVERALWKVRSRLKDALKGRDMKEYFRSIDRDGNGVLGEEEVKMLVRVGLDISEEEVSDEHLEKLHEMLDRDDSGTLVIQELTFFLDKGPEALFAEPSQEDVSKKKNIPRPKKSKKGVLAGKEGLLNFQKALKIAAAKESQAGKDYQSILSGYDGSRNGYLDMKELDKFIVKELQIPEEAFCDADVMELIYKLGGGGRGVKIKILADMASPKSKAVVKEANPNSLQSDKPKKFFQKKLKLAVSRQINHGEGDFQCMFNRYDPNSSGTLDIQELTRLLIHELHIPKESFSDLDVKTLIIDMGAQPSKGVDFKTLDALVNEKPKDGGQKGGQMPRAASQGGTKRLAGTVAQSGGAQRPGTYTRHRPYDPYDPKNKASGNFRPDAMRRNSRKIPLYSTRAWHEMPHDADIHTRLYYETTDGWDHAHVLKYGALRPPGNSVPIPKKRPRPMIKQEPIDEDALPRWGAGGVAPRMPKKAPPRVRARRQKAVGETRTVTLPAETEKGSSPAEKGSKAEGKTEDKAEGKDSASKSEEHEEKQAAKAKPEAKKMARKLENKDQAATAIQANWRGRQQRRVAGAKKSASAPKRQPRSADKRPVRKERFADQDSAAKAIQSGWRGRQREVSGAPAQSSQARRRRPGKPSLQGYDAGAVRRSLGGQFGADSLMMSSKEGEALRRELQQRRQQIGQLLSEFKDAAAAEEQERLQLQAALTQHEQLERTLREELLRLEPEPEELQGRPAGNALGHQRGFKEHDQDRRQQGAASTIQRQWRKRQEVGAGVADASAKGFRDKDGFDDRSPSPGGPRELDEPEGEIGPRAEKQLSEPAAASQERKQIKRQRTRDAATYQSGQLRSKFKKAVAATTAANAFKAFGDTSKASARDPTEQKTAEEDSGSGHNQDADASLATASGAGSGHSSESRRNSREALNKEGVQGVDESF
mmetsp:Transcript_124635/g.228714  ORF Transcript_124635/g.228714 Transcript_124635/m.228714 type:complete len:2401 (-) Transcript_124635:127-7329(-)